MSLATATLMTLPTSVLISESRLRTSSTLGLIMSVPGRQFRVYPRRRPILLLLLLLLLLPFVFEGRRRVLLIHLFLILLLVVVVLCRKSL